MRCQPHLIDGAFFAIDQSGYIIDGTQSRIDDIGSGNDGGWRPGRALRSPIAARLNLIAVTPTVSRYLQTFIAVPAA